LNAATDSKQEVYRIDSEAFAASAVFKEYLPYVTPELAIPWPDVIQFLTLDKSQEKQGFLALIETQSERIVTEDADFSRLTEDAILIYKLLFQHLKTASTNEPIEKTRSSFREKALLWTGKRWVKITENVIWANHANVFGNFFFICFTLEIRF
jgi:hypothetical protein